MIRLKDLLKETASPESLIAQWKQTVSPKELKYFCKRDNCGPAALSFMQFLTKHGAQELNRVEGYFKADSVVYDKADFTEEMKQEFISDGGNWNNADDRKQWIETSEYADQWKFIPHYWVRDSQGNIYDPVGEEQFIKTKLAADLNKDRYSLTGIPDDQSDVNQLNYE